MNLPKDKEDSKSSHLTGIVVTGIFGVIIACVSGVFLLVSSLINNGFIAIGPSLQSGQPTVIVVTATSQIEVPTITQVASLPQPSATIQQPTQQLISPTKASRTIPQSASDAANLFGGPSTNDWQACPQENNCWMFSLPNNSFKISVPEYCLNGNGSIDGWRYHGGYPEQPDTVEGTIRIWNSLEAATIRCR